MAEANRIFGFDGWDRLSLSHQLIYERREGELTLVAYWARVRVIVRAGPSPVVREGSGFGAAGHLDGGEAHRGDGAGAWLGAIRAKSALKKDTKNP